MNKDFSRSGRWGRIKAWSILVLIAVVIGCVTTSYNFDFPSDIESMCYGAKNASKDRLNAKGVSLEEKMSCKVKKQLGEKLFSGIWGWRSTEWDGMWVLGLCGGNWIKVGCHPQTMGDVNSEVLVHEFAHYWLMSNHNDWTHDPKYADLFMNWREPRLIVARSVDAVKRVYDQLEDEETISVVFESEDGSRVHIDFIKGPQ